MLAKEREKEEAWSWVSVEVGRFWEELEKENNDQNIVHEKEMFRLKEDKEKWEPKLIHVFLEIIVSVKDSKTSTSYRVEIDTYDALKSLNGKN